MFAELAEARRIAPRVPARELLESATLTGARALGFGDEFGSIEAGKRAALIAVRVPAGVADVEEYLVGGVEPDAITWLDSQSSPSVQTRRSDDASSPPISRSSASATRCSRCRLR